MAPEKWTEHVAERWRSVQVEAGLNPDEKHASAVVFAALPWLATWREETAAATVEFRIDQGTFPADVNKLTQSLTKMVSNLVSALY